MSAPHIHRCTADSKTGRKLRSANTKVIEGPGLTKEQQEWNAKIAAERAAKKTKRAG